jgi:hypothetical protein
MSQSEEPNQGSDHTQGFLLLRFLRGKLRLFRVRDFSDALKRGGPFE